MVAAWKELEKKTGKRWYQLIAPNGDLTQEKVYVPLEGVTDFWPAKQVEIDALLKRELSLELQIAESYQGYLSQTNLWDAKRFDIPANRLLTVGDEIEYGNIQDCKVVALHEDGQVVSFLGTRHDRDRTERSVYTCSWLRAFPKCAIQPTNLYVAPRYASITPTNSTLGSQVSHVWEQGMNDNPDYQRGYVWTEKDEQHFLDSVFSGKNLGTFVFLRHEYPKSTEIFDGKQRLTTMLRLVSGQLAYKGVYWHEMSRVDRHQVEDRMVSVITVRASEFSRADLLQMFLDINAAGVPQTEEHLAHVRGLLAQELSQAKA